MIRSVQLLGAAALALALAASWGANAQTAYHGTKHRKATKPTAETGRQITIHKATPSYLTLGPGANLGPTNNYVTDTFAQPSPIEGTFSGMRGRERLDANRYNGPGVPLFRF
jgi:hypothetical protein